MCRTGGRRCTPHVEAYKAATANRLKKWQEELPKRQAAYEANQTKKNIERVEAAVRNIAIEEDKLSTFAAELDSIANRQQARGDVLTQWTGVNLKGEEWDALAVEAEQQGATRSELIRERLTGLPVITPIKGAELPRPTYKGESTLGRQPTTGTVGDYKRAGRGVRNSERELERLREEATLFGLDASDYERCLIMGLDPRSFGHHHKKEKADQLREKVVDLEEQAAANGQTIQDYWHSQIQRIRARYSN